MYSLLQFVPVNNIPVKVVYLPFLQYYETMMHAIIATSYSTYNVKRTLNNTVNVLSCFFQPVK